MTGVEMTNDWQRWGLEPFARVAPPWSHVLGPRRLVVAEFDLASSDWRVLSDDWRLDAATTLSGEVGLLPGDLVVWVGAQEDGGSRHVWAPALVVEASASRRGRQNVSAVAFDRHESVEDPDVLRWVDRLVANGAAVVTGSLRSGLLDLWGLDVTCPQCGAVGVPITWGLPAPDDYERRAPTCAEDSGSATWLGGCVVTFERYACHRCSHRWPQPGGAFVGEPATGVDMPWDASQPDADPQEG